VQWVLHVVQGVKFDKVVQGVYKVGLSLPVMLRYSGLQTPGWLKIIITLNKRIRSESFRLKLAFPPM
jgi:hypothetical protein